MLYEFGKVGKEFRLPGEAISYDIISNGNINSTYKVNYRNPDGTEKSYIFQKINTYVFKDPIEIMHNIDLVTEHIRAKNPGKIALHFHHTDDRKNYVIGDHSFWRVMNYVNSVTYNICQSLDIIRSAGEAFGEFQMQLSDFDGALLHETIPDFHNTKKRLDTLFAHATLDEYGHAHEMEKELEYIRSVRERACELSVRYANGEFPVRVTHNDTKVNNVLFDKQTGKPLVVIDLDTVMPGMAMYDFADAVRFTCSSAVEDEADLKTVYIDIDKFRAFTEGFLSKVSAYWTEAELESLVDACFAITIELAARFLDDYLTGNKYFKTLYGGHNAVRTRCQLKLAQSIDENYDVLKEIVKTARK